MSYARVTQHSISANALANMQGALGRVSNLSDQLSSGRKLSRPSDSPSGTVSAIATRASLRAEAQIARNADDGLGWLKTADGAMAAALPLLRTATQRALQGASTGAMGPEARAALADDVDSLRDEMLSVANSRYQGRAVFGGTQVGDAYTVVPPAVGSPPGTPSTYTYNGDGGAVTRRTEAASVVAVNTPGDAVFGSGATTVFDELTALAAHLRTDPSLIDADLDALDARLGMFTAGAADIGARYARVERSQQASDDRALGLRSTLSSIENIDLPQTIVDLQMQQVAYQAALGATAKVIQPTLMDFLR